MPADNIEKNFEHLTGQVSEMANLFTKAKEEQEKAYKALADNLGGKADNEVLDTLKKELTNQYADASRLVQDLGGEIESLKKQLDNPHFGSKKDRDDANTEAAIALQKRVFLSTEAGATELDFKADMDNLIDATSYRKAAQKMLQLGLKTKEEIVRTFTADEKKAFDMASMDIAFFSPELLGIVLDCNIECWSINDLYRQVNVSKSTFAYPKIESYGDLGSYACDAACDAELGPEGNVRWLNGQTYDYRGVFCFQKKTLQEANFPILEFMFGAANRSYRINRNDALINGDGVNRPLGWLKADCFTKRQTTARIQSGGEVAQPAFDHIDYRRFISSHPVEYGRVIPVMHQNIFAYLAAKTDSTGRFIFGDGDMTFSPDAVRDSIRISNCLPDATEGGTRGDVANPFLPGEFLLAAANWEMAYTQVSKEPLTMEQYIGGTTKWCVKYQFGAEDGGFVGCCPAGMILQTGGVEVTEG